MQTGIVKRIGNNVVYAGRFDTRSPRFMYTRNYFNLVICAFGYGIAICRHVN